MFKVDPVSHSDQKTDRTDYRERCWKTIPRRVDPVVGLLTLLLMDS